MSSVFAPGSKQLPIRFGVALPPAVASLDEHLLLAQAAEAAGLDLIGGRFELGLGSGGYWDAIKTFGVRPLTRAQSVDALEEAIAIIRALWSGAHGIRFSGDHYRLEDATGGPTPPHEIGIWIGAQGTRLLETTGRLAPVSGDHGF